MVVKRHLKVLTNQSSARKSSKNRRKINGAAQNGSPMINLMPRETPPSFGNSNTRDSSIF
jgi:hypothetical protein